MGNKKIPTSWFDDDPEWEMLRYRAENRPIPKKLKQRVEAQKPQIRNERERPRTQTTREDTDKEVVVNLKIAVPKVKFPDLRQLYKIHKRRIFITVSTIAILVLAVGILKLVSGRQMATGNNKTVSSPKEQAEAVFNPLVPLNNVTDVTGNRTEPAYRYDQEKKMLAYSTEHSGVAMTISQQPIPEKVKSNPRELASIAKSLSANNSLETQKGMAYIATDEKTEAQTAIFATKEVLVFIRADKKLDAEEWKFYINQLNPSR